MIWDHVASLSPEEQRTLGHRLSWAKRYYELSIMGLKEKANDLRDKWRDDVLQDPAWPGRTLELFGLREWFRRTIEDVAAPLDALPTGAFLIRFRLRLRSPYLSRASEDFHIIDNPITLEKVFALPMVAPSGWKGALRSAIRQTQQWRNNHAELRCLFGEARDEDGGSRGRLYCFPTFFDSVGLEIINPHDRARRVGKNPILMECVPVGSVGGFHLLYVPLDRIGRVGVDEEEETLRQATRHMVLAAQGVRAMLTEYGIGAKTSSGYGLADNDVVGEGELMARVPAGVSPVTTVPAASAPNTPRYLESKRRLTADFRDAEGRLVMEEEYRRRVDRQGRKYSKSEQQIYAKAQRWWQSTGETFHAQGEPEGTPAPATPAPPITQPMRRTFHSLDELVQRAEESAQSRGMQ